MPDLPESFDRFDILRVLGRGGMGTVYLARDSRLGRQAALKVLNAEDLESEDRRARFMREARAAAAIRHQNVATIYEVDETDEGIPFIVMEYCEGETLAQRMRRRPLDAGEFLQVGRQLAAAVAAAHDNGVIHRDLKSANIIIEPSGLVKVLDFGLARLLQREFSATPGRQSFESTAGQFFGTLHYLSPEQARGQQADARSDLFSLGVVYYQMASGHLPFNADSPLLVLERIRDTEPEPFVPIDPAFPVTATKIIGKLLQKDPAQRYQNATELLGDLETIDTPTVRLTGIHSHNSLARTIRRPAWTRLVLIVAAFAVLAAGVWFVHQEKNDAKTAVTAPVADAPTPIRSLAVLPLSDISNNAKDDFLSVGLADALVTKLQQVRSLQVRPTSDVLEFHNEKTDVKTASRKLQVDAILEGRFFAAGDLVRVTLQLTDARTGYNVWSDTIDGKRSDLLKLIDDVSNHTITGLSHQLGVQQQSVSTSMPRSTNPRAYEAYLRARALTGSLVPQQHAEQMAALQSAIELDPKFAAAYADLAISISLAQARGFATDPDAMVKAEGYARQAVRLDPNLPQAHLALGRVFVRLPGRFREAVRENLAALRLNGNDVQALNSLINYFISTGELDRSVCLEHRLLLLDPLSNEAESRGYWNLNAVDAEGALNNAQYALARKETELAGHDLRGSAYVLLGNLDGAQAEAEAAIGLVPKHYLGKSLRAEVAAARGNRVAAEAALRSFEEDANKYHWAALRQGLCFAKLGDRDKALHWLQIAADNGNHSWYMLTRHPWLADLQSDPELARIVAPMKADLDDVRDDVIGVQQLLCE